MQTSTKTKRINASTYCWALLMFFLTCFCGAQSTYASFDCSTASDVSQTECQALVDLYDATGGPAWFRQTNWEIDTAVCSWEGVSCNGSMVDTLYLDNVGIVGNIPASFGDLVHVRMIYMQNNTIASLPSTLPNLSSLEYLYLDNNILTSLPTNFGDIPSLREFTVRNNLLTSLPDSIGNLSLITQLSISQNRLTTLPASINGLANLNYIYADSNQITTLPALTGLVNLINLELSSNALVSLPSTITGLPNLQRLNISRNSLTTLPASIGNISSLIYLYADQNQLTTLPPEIGQLHNLNQLQISNNAISSLPSTMSGLTNLYYFYLSNNQLTSLPTQIGFIPNLSYLYADNNQLTTIPSSFSNLTNLQYLGLNNNNIQSFPTNLNPILNLQLSLANNNLTSLPVGLGTITNLRYLNIDNNRISTFTGLEQLTGLQTLSANNNRLKVLSTGSIAAFARLHNLYLSNNVLTDLPDVLGSLGQLIYLNLDNNRLQYLPTSIGNMPSLRQLNMTYNRLQTLPESFQNLTGLYNSYGLYVYGNCIQTSGMSTGLINFVSSKTWYGGYPWGGQWNCSNQYGADTYINGLQPSTWSPTSGSAFTVTVQYGNNQNRQSDDAMGVYMDVAISSGASWGSNPGWVLITGISITDSWANQCNGPCMIYRYALPDLAWGQTGQQSIQLIANNTASAVSVIAGITGFNEAPSWSYNNIQSIRLGRLVVDKIVDMGSGYRGDILTYTISYDNQGQNGINNLSLIEEIGTGLDNVTYTPSLMTGYLKKTYGIAGDQCLDDFYLNTGLYFSAIETSLGQPIDTWMNNNGWKYYFGGSDSCLSSLTANDVNSPYYTSLTSVTRNRWNQSLFAWVYINIDSTITYGQEGAALTTYCTNLGYTNIRKCLIQQKSVEFNNFYPRQDASCGETITSVNSAASLEQACTLGYWAGYRNVTECIRNQFGIDPQASQFASCGAPKVLGVTGDVCYDITANETGAYFDAMDTWAKTQGYQNLNRYWVDGYGYSNVPSLAGDRIISQCTTWGYTNLSECLWNQFNVDTERFAASCGKPVSPVNRRYVGNIGYGSAGSFTVQATIATGTATGSYVLNNLFINSDMPLRDASDLVYQAQTLVLGQRGLPPSAASILTPISGDVFYTNTVAITGTGEAHSIFTILDNTILLGTGLVSGSGEYSFPSSWSTGNHLVTVYLTNIRGTSPHTETTFAIYDLTGSAPSAPILLSPSSGETITGTSLIFSGSGESGAVFTLIDGSGFIISTGIVDGNGLFSYSHTGLAEGSYMYSLLLTNMFGSSPVTYVSFGVVAPGGGGTGMTGGFAPSKPTILAPLSGSTITGTSIISGTGQSGSQFTITNASGFVLGTGIVDAVGNFNFTPTFIFPQGVNTIVVTLTNVYGISTPSIVTFTIDPMYGQPTAPVQPIPTVGGFGGGGGSSSCTPGITSPSVQSPTLPAQETTPITIKPQSNPQRINTYLCRVTFKDILTDAYFVDISRLRALCIVRGRASDLYMPDSALTTKEAIIVLSRIISMKKAGHSIYSNLSNDAQAAYYDDVKQTLEKHILDKIDRAILPGEFTKLVHEAQKILVGPKNVRTIVLPAGLTVFRSQAAHTLVELFDLTNYKK